MKRIVISSAVLALAISGAGLAQAESGFKVTGGGQALTEAGAENGVKGPGDTYGFNAQDIDGADGDLAKGQFNSIQRDGAATTGKGKGEHIKGEVTCLVVPSEDEEFAGAARFGGIVRNAGTPETPVFFAVDVTDNGEGQAEDDVIVYRQFEGSPGDNPCDNEPEEPTDESEIVLARGNVQIHNQPEA